MSKLQYCPPQCDLLAITTGNYLYSASNEIEKADATVYGDDFWSTGA
ncbi:MAG: hypothetical protein II047_12060 [Bacteroidales bacterium]|nr:hypothetical protein [Bacteroidales bacterium]